MSIAQLEHGLPCLRRKLAFFVILARGPRLEVRPQYPLVFDVMQEHGHLSILARLLVLARIAWLASGRLLLAPIRQAHVSTV